MITPMRSTPELGVSDMPRIPDEPRLTVFGALALTIAVMGAIYAGLLAVAL